MAVELPTDVLLPLIKTCIYMFLCSVSSSLLFYSLFLHFIHLLLRFLVNLLCTLGIYFTCFFQNSYYRSSGHVVLECRIAFGNIHFLCKLILFMHFYRHYNFNLWFSFILPTKFFVFPRILTILGSFAWENMRQVK